MPSFNIPKIIAKTTAKAVDFIWWPTLSPDEIERRYINDTIDPNTKTFADLGIEPQELESLALMFLRRYRSSAYFDQPSTATPRLKKGEYHVIE